jgi:ABC-2 type transport system ATP-binding protein
MTDLMIQAQGLTKHYRKLEAVRGIDLAVRQGEIFGIVGPDGAGKTTTIQMLTGILTPTSGEARVAGVDVVRQADRLGGKIGYMSEGFTLYGTLSVEENLDFFADLYGVQSNLRRERKAQLLQFARLEEARRRRAEHLSGGMKKKLALACTLMYSPQVLFLDEPTSGVDPISRRSFWDLIYELSAQGVTIFVTTHYMDEAEHCHTLGLLYYGQIIALGSPAGMKSNMKAGQMLEIDVSDALKASNVISEQPGVQSAAPYGDKLHVLVWGDADDAVDSLARSLAAADLPPRRIERIELSLEDLFIIFIEMQEAGRRTRMEAIE